MSNELVIPEHEQPNWMRSARQRFDWSIVIVAVLSLMLAWPFLFSEGLPRTNDAERYAFRSADMAQALREGWLYPRWSAHAMFGYGAPIPNFEAPAAPYLTALIEVLFTNDPVVAVRLVFILSFLLAGTGTYLLARRHSEAGTAIIAATLYVYSPQVGLNAPHLSGDLAIMLGLGLLPWTVWQMDRMLWQQRSRAIALGALLQALLLLTEPRIWACNVVIIAGLALLALMQQRQSRALIQSLSMIILSLGLSAFYWLPALSESGALRWIELSPPASMINPSLMSILQPAFALDPLALKPAQQAVLGLVLMLGTLLSLPALLLRIKGYSSHAFFLLASGLFILAGLQRLIPIDISVGVTSLCLAQAASRTMLLRFRWRPVPRRIALGAATALILAFSTAVWRVPAQSTAPVVTTPPEQVRFEQQGYGIAVLPTSRLVPTMLASTVRPNPLLLNGYASNNLNRFGETTLDQSEASVLESTTQSLLYLIRLHRPGPVTMLLAYDPGWRATLNGQPLPIERSLEGLIVVDLPPIRGSQLSLRLEETPVRAAGWILALFSLFLTGSFLLNRQERRYEASVHVLGQDELRMLTVVVGTSIAITLFLISPLVPQALQPVPGSGLQSIVGLGYRTDTGLEAIGYRLSQTLAHPGDRLEITLYWQALRFIPDNYQIRLQIRNVEQGQVVATESAQAPGHYPTRRWQRNLYVVDTHALSLPSDLAPGRYVVTVEALRCQPDCTSGQRLVFFNEAGQEPGSLLTLAQIITVIPH